MVTNDEKLIQRICACGCGLTFKTTSESRQTYATDTCDPGVHHTKRGEHTTHRDGMSVRIAEAKIRQAVYRKESLIIPEPKRVRLREQTGNKPRSGGDYEHEWNRCVEEARKRIITINTNRMVIATLCLQVCETKHGGGDHWSGFSGRKTMKEFAEEVGIPYKTLNVWVRIKRHIVTKLGDKYDTRNYGAALRTLTYLEGSGKKLLKASPEEVAERYEKEQNRTGPSYDILQAKKRMRALKNKIIRDIDMKECEEVEVLELTLMVAEVHRYLQNLKAIEVEAV